MVITTAMNKGGTGKTTTAAALAQAAAHAGLKCLAIDADPQANLSYCLGAERGPDAFNFITGEQFSIQHSAQQIDVIPASWDLTTIRSDRGSARRLKKALERIKDQYQLIVIDTPATAGELQYNAIYAADLLIVTMKADVYNLTSVYQTIHAARKIQPEINTGVVITDYSTNTNVTRQMREMLEKNAAALGVPCFGFIRHGIVVQEAAAFQLSLFDYAPRSNPARDYMATWQAIREAMQQEGN